MPRLASTYRAARRNAARGSVWSPSWFGQPAPTIRPAGEAPRLGHNDRLADAVMRRLPWHPDQRKARGRG